ncbi:MAG TPA: aspartate kinase [Xanthobacteraceae bacterium]|nr:aspartate kinase [Xanthobacteraceae bacterium]
MAAMPDVVKIGGSAFGEPRRLRALLAGIAGRGAPLVVVAGGGALADAVRAVQPQLGLSDAAAHHMAILAMEQTALALADLEPRLAAFDSLAGLRAAHATGRASLWLPAAMARRAPLPASWDVTSDSLALWLAIELGAARLTLVKSAQVSHPSGPPAVWLAQGLVDRYVPLLAPRFAGALRAVSLDAVLAEQEETA